MPLSSIKSQKHAIDMLLAAQRESRLAHSYIFFGPEGSLKKRVAIEFTKSINCQNKKNDSCNSCSSCVKIGNLSHPDLFIISKEDTKTKISIDSIRYLNSRIALKSFEAKYKVAIIENAESMTQEAANSLLNVLEEPPKDTIFILLTSNIKALLDTIVSRSQVIRFKSLSCDEVSSMLIKDHGISKKDADLLAVLSDRNISKALRLNEQDMLTFKNSIITWFLEGSLSREEAGSQILTEKRPKQTEALDMLIGFIRDVLVYKMTKDDSLIINIDKIDDISSAAETQGIQTLQENIEAIEKTKFAINANVNGKLALRLLQEKLAV